VVGALRYARYAFEAIELSRTKGVDELRLVGIGVDNKFLEFWFAAIIVNERPQHDLLLGCAMFGPA